MNGVALIYLLVLILAVGLIIARDGITAWYKWYKSGFCTHDWKLYNTCSFGQKHWYKCTKCNEKKLR